MSSIESSFSPSIVQQFQGMIAKMGQNRPETPPKAREEVKAERIYRWRQQAENRLHSANFDGSQVVDLGFALQVAIDLAAVREEEYDVKANKIEKEDRVCSPPPCGLILMGFPGTGKTMLANILARIPYPSLPVYSIGEITLEYERGGLDNVDRKFRELYSGDIVLDDLGVHDERKHFGNASIVDEILFQRYRLWKDNRRTTIITTNLPYFRKKQSDVDEPAGFRDVFGEAISERIEEMCYPIRFVGDSKRIPAGKRFGAWQQ